MTYIKQDAISKIPRGIDDMGEDEYANDEVADIETDAVEISATSRPANEQRKSFSSQIRACQLSYKISFSYLVLA